VQSRVVPRPKQEVWDAVIKLLDRQKFTEIDKDFEQGAISTSWDPICEDFRSVFVDAYIGGEVQNQFEVRIHSIDKDAVRIDVTIRMRMPADKSAIEVHPRCYDLWYNRLGRRLDVQMPDQVPIIWMKTKVK